MTDQNVTGDDVTSTRRVDPAALPNCPFHPQARLKSITHEVNRPSVYVHRDGVTHGDLMSLLKEPRGGGDV